jgi:hypothetical protein
MVVVELLNAGKFNLSFENRHLFRRSDHQHVNSPRDGQVLPKIV